MLGEGQELPSQKQTFSSGVNYDQSPEKVFNKENSGFFIDGHNVQPVSTGGNDGDLVKIKGEVLLYPNTNNNTGYECLAADTVNGKIVELWAPPNTSFPSIIRVDGVIVLSNLLLDLRKDFPLQWDINNSVANGEIAFTDKRVPPYVLNIQDMLDNISTQKYFTAFVPEEHQINIQSSLDIPVFVELINVGGGGGKPVGQYQYQLRYSSTAGDRTQWSHPTPLIPVMEALSSSSDQYPWVKTYGGPPQPTRVTSLAPKLRFRVTNLYNYDFIEIKCTPYNAGAGIQYTSNGFIVARIDVSPGEISIREYIDPQESNVNIALSAEEESQELAHIEKAGSVKYFDRRLEFADITLASKEADLNFLTLSENTVFPVIDKIYKPGYNDPWNHTYKRSFMRGETEGFGVNLYDCVGNSGFVSKMDQATNYTFPNRRDRVSSHTKTYSLNNVVRAAMTNDTNGVDYTHEVFDLGDRIFKTDKCDFKNIIESGRILGLTGTKLITPFGVNQDCDETNEEIENHGTRVSALDLVSCSYQPFTPVRQNDQNVEGHNYIVNNKVAKGNIKIGPIVVENEDVKDYRPAGFAPNYYAMGLCVVGIDNFPKWAKAFSVVRTGAAKRVVAQGLAYYSLIKGKFKLVGNENLGGKNTNKFWFYSPDIENGIVASDTVNDIIDNPQNYRLQFVSPLGFFSEWYSAEDNIFQGQRDRCIDMISYVRMISDVTGPDNCNINPMEDPEMGIDGGDGNRYVAYDKFRNLTVIPNTFSGDPAQGNKTFGINVVTRKAEGRGTYLEIEVDQDVYASVFTGGNGNANFQDGGMQNFTEPIYVVNIIRTGAEIRDKELQGYKQTTHYQKIESIIGKSNGNPGQIFPLVDERWEDCIPAPLGGHFGASDSRYIYIKLIDGTVQRWINVTYKSAFDLANIEADIAAGVGGNSGAYTHINLKGQSRFYEINFNVAGYVPPEGSLILVRYDNGAPIRVFGGDTFIGEAIFSPIDSQGSPRDTGAETQFAMGIGLPYREFKINPRYYTIKQAGASSITSNPVQDKEWFTLGFIRQLCAMFTVESRACMPLAYNSEYPNQFFPLINYVIRPNRWDFDKTIGENYIYDDYQSDYLAQEKNNWQWGGFRFLPQINSDYSIEPPIRFFSKPTIGFVERVDYPTRTMWSLPRAINIQNAPSIKTFPANNSFDIDDNQGNIQYLWSSVTEAGENLYAITEKGICMLLTKKTILSQLNASQLGLMGTDSFIGGQHWFSRDIGIPDKMWRSIAKASVSMENGTAKQALFFVNLLSVYRLMDNQITDISGNYYLKLYEQGIALVLDGVQTKMCSVYDLYKDQLYIHFDGPGLLKTFVYSPDGNWYGTNDFRFDRFVSYNGDSYGMRDMKTYHLNEGYKINGVPIVSSVLTAFSPESDKDKEFIRIRINSKNKPGIIHFYKEKNGIVQYIISQVTNGPMYLKNYRGYEADIGRILATVNANRPRMQGRLLIAEIINNLEEEFVLTDVTIEYKKIL